MQNLTVLVVDTNSARGKANAKVFYDNNAETYLYSNRRVQAPNWDREVDFPDEFTLLILHGNDEFAWEELKSQAQIIIWYTGGNPTTLSAKPTALRHRSISGAEDAISPDEAKEILAWVQGVISGLKDVALPGVLRESALILLPTLSILCQAYLAVRARCGECTSPEVVPALEKMGWVSFLSESNSSLILERLNSTQTAECNSHWWLNALGIVTTEQWEEFQATVNAEWQETVNENISHELKQILSALWADSEELTPEIVAKCYSAIAQNLNIFTDKIINRASFNDLQKSSLNRAVRAVADLLLKQPLNFSTYANWDTTSLKQLARQLAVQPDEQTVLLLLRLGSAGTHYEDWISLLSAVLQENQLGFSFSLDKFVVELLQSSDLITDSSISKAGQGGECDWQIIPNEDIKDELAGAEGKNRLLSWAKLELKAPVSYRPLFSHLVGGTRPIVYVFDDYNNYINWQKNVYQVNPESLNEEIAAYYGIITPLDGKVNKVDLFKEILTGFCLNLNNLSQGFEVKAPRLAIPDTESSYEVVCSALPFGDLERERSRIAAFIVDLEWRPTITDYRHQPSRQWSQMGYRAIHILSQRYPEIPSFIFTGLQPTEELQQGLANGASWGFFKEKHHHFEKVKRDYTTERLTSITLEKHLEKATYTRCGSYKEVPFPNQLKVNPHHPAGRQLIDQLNLAQPIGKCHQGQALQKLIAQLFPSATIVEPVKILDSGKSQAQATLFVCPSNEGRELATRFIKIGPWLSIQREHLAYQQVIQPRLNSYTASIIQKPVITQGDQGKMPWGGLMYSLAGFPEGHKKLHSLNSLFEEYLENSSGTNYLLTRVQSTLENVLLPLYKSSIPQERPLWHWLENVIPAIYTGELIPLAQLKNGNPDADRAAAIKLSSYISQGYEEPAAWALASQQLNQLAELKDSNLVLLSGWYLIEANWENETQGKGIITLVHPDLGMRCRLRSTSQDVRLRFAAPWIRPGMPVEVLARLDSESQEIAKINSKLQANFYSLGLSEEIPVPADSHPIPELLHKFARSNKLSEEELPNPFTVFATNFPLPYTISARAGAIHGDLNLNNILYAGDERVGWLIDFEMAKEGGMIAYDFAKLEVEIWNHHLFPRLVNLANLLSVNSKYKCFQLLHQTLQAAESAGEAVEWFVPMGNALKVIKAIRYFALSECHITTRELKWALAAYFFNSAKFTNLSHWSSILAFLASSWHLQAVLTNRKI